MPEPIRLDRFLADRYPSVPRNEFARLIASGGVLVNERPARKGLTLRGGEEIRLHLPAARAEWTALPDASIPLAVHFEDEHLLAVEKPAGVASHPHRPDETGTLANAIVARYAGQNRIGEPLQAGLLHRLDGGTSGLMVAARNQEAFERLRAIWRSEQVEKVYLAIVRGVVTSAGRVDAPLAPHPKSARKMVVAGTAPLAGAQSAHTTFEPVQVVGERALLRVRIREGRRHQIRVHLESIGHPIVGDKLYDPTTEETELALHSHQITIPHPQTQETIPLTSPLPPRLHHLLQKQSPKK